MNRPRLSPSALVATFLLVIGGLIGMYWTANALKKDVQNGRWCEEDLQPYTDFFVSPTMNLVSVLLLVLLMASILVTQKFRFTAGPLIILSNLQFQLSVAFRRPATSAPAGKFNWASRPPLRSDHWGER